MQHNVFRDTSLKLTAIYLSIVMFISLLFSISLYSISAQEIERGIRREGPVTQIFRTRNSELIQDLIHEQDEAIDEAQNRIRGSLILINLFILFGGGFLSYFFAKRTLQPIEQAHRSLEQFTADASHELRTPITAMRAETELTLTEDKLTLTKAKHQLESNIEELDKLTELSEGLLQLARFDENGLEKSLASLEHLIQQAVETATPKAAKKKQTIILKTVPPVRVPVNKPALTQVLTILLDNAIKYSPEATEIKLKVTKSKNTVSVRVEDKGIGIRASEIPHIFDRFYRADSSRSKGATSGYGIGLSIAKTVMNLHSGTITVKSTQGKGSTFTITLPL